MHFGSWLAIGLCATLVSGCVSTTQSPLTGHDRKQLLLIPQNFYAQRSQKAYERSAKQKTVVGVTYINDPRMTRIMQNLVPHANAMLAQKRKINWQAKVVLSHTPNAYSLPSGQVILHSALAWDPQFTEAELSHLIAHEMIHIVREHSREKMSRGLVGQAGLLGTMTGVGATAYTVGSVINMLAIDLPHSRAIEHEADLLSLELMARAGIDARASLSFWEKTQKIMKRTNTVSKLPTVFSTHAHVDERLPIIEAYLTKLEQQSVQATIEQIQKVERDAEQHIAAVPSKWANTPMIYPNGNH